VLIDKLKIAGFTCDNEDNPECEHTYFSDAKYVAVWRRSEYYFTICTTLASGQAICVEVPCNKITGLKD